MKNVHQRVALMAGVSLSVLGVATPVEAATTVSHGISHVDTTNPVDDTLLICGIADDCDFGVDASGIGLVSAVVDNPANGQIFQSGTATSADAVVNMTNEGAARISARAVATGAGSATASAIVLTGVEQVVDVRGGDGAANISNDGLLNIDASAAASATGPAHALAVVARGLEQTARGSDVLASITNSGTLDMHAVANAKGAGGSATVTSSGFIYRIAAGASATAVLSGGIVQSAGGQQNGTASLVNTGAISLGATAHASGPGFETTLAGGTMLSAGPRAFALVGGAIVQSEFTPRGDGSVTLDNEGTLSIAAIASATSTGVGQASARAWAEANIIQAAMGSTGLASANINNSGTLTIGAIANAKATDVGAAFADALVLGGVHQTAMSAGTASAELDNAGSITIGAQGQAIANNNLAQAIADISTGIAQFVNGQTLAIGSGASGTTLVGNARASMANEGTIQIRAGGFASGAAAQGNGFVGVGIDQLAIAAGDASAALMNDGLIEVSADGSAVATAGGAFAGASVVIGLGQRAFATSSATVHASNAGTMAFNASAHAVAQTIDGGAAGTAVAVAHLGEVTFVGVEGAIDQQAIGSAASVGLSNSGSLALGADAVASGSGAVAAANLISGIRQLSRSSGGPASAIVENDGTLAMAATAVAHATGGGATAVASVGGAIAQTAIGMGGNAMAGLTNSGTLVISGAAQATGTGDASAYAIVNGVGQNAFATSGAAAAAASALFTNSGEFDVTAIAKATAGTHVVQSSSGSSHLALIIPPGGGGGVDMPTATAIADVFALAQAATNASIVNSGTMSVAIGASANGPLAANAQAHGTLIYQQARNMSGGVASASLANDGTIGMIASAAATASQGFARASAGMNGTGHAIEQHASAATALNSLANSAIIDLGSIARADGETALAAASIRGILQQAAGSSAAQTFVNSGTYQVVASGSAAATLAHAFASANDGIFQGGTAAKVVQNVTNSGSFTLAAHAVADGGSSAGAMAFAQFAVNQILIGATGSENAINSGTLAVAANATATGGRANAVGLARDALHQEAFASSVHQVALNSGVLSVAASAKAVGATMAAANAFAVDGIEQFASALAADQAITNAGTYTALANANAVATGTLVPAGGTGSSVAGMANANAQAMGVLQSGWAHNSLQSITNSGTLNVGAHAVASAPSADTAHGAVAAGFALANAIATGVSQLNFSSGSNTQSFVNSGKVNVGAAATAVGATGAAMARANGLVVNHYAGTQNVAVVNSGVMNVAASAIAPGSGFAHAQGILVQNAAAWGGTANAVAGTITNAGTLNVFAKAHGDGMFTSAFTVPTSGGGVTNITVTHTLSAASATGIGVNGGVNNMTISNSGTINVEAVTSKGDPANAYGIRVMENGTVAPAATDVTTINNSGDIIARYSTDGGTTFHRATAIDVTEAPNPTVINLLGGNVTGDINVQDGDAINVTTGETNFNGVINAGCYDAAAIAGGDPTLSSCGVGTLTVNGGGNLHLLNDAVDGPSYAFVNTLTVGADGTLTLDLPAAAGGAAAPGTYPQIFADTANLGGTLVANIRPANGLFDNASYDNVIDANTRNGTFAKCALAGPYTN
ncbi:MAG TPA: hypothetical protein VE820_05080, partial [Sphingomicrobium sp.]|nr:hypothetical protein [Sphingomicrobium sp.]